MPRFFDGIEKHAKRKGKYRIQLITNSPLKSLNYNDILLLPVNSEIESRDCINLQNKDGYIPIFSAPMSNISEPNLVAELGRLGCIGILHRFFKRDEDKYDAISFLGSTKNYYGISISIHEWQKELEYVKYAVEKNHCNFVVIDTASGYLKITIDAVKSLYDFRAENKLDFKIMAGNVVDNIGCYHLINAGADIIRVNIGTGLQCLTSKSIGIGCPPLTAIKNCSNIYINHPEIILLADGGIYTPGDALKALCFGAKGVMIGSLFGRAKEADNNGVIFGMSSYMLQERMNKTKKSNEGTITVIPKEEIKPLKDILNEFIYGLKSGLSYLGIDDINKILESDIEYIKI